MRDSMPRCRLSDRNHCALVCFASRFYSVVFCLRPFATIAYDRLPTVCEPAPLHSYNQDLPSRVLARIVCRQTPTMQARIDPGLRSGLLGKKLETHAGKNDDWPSFLHIFVSVRCGVLCCGVWLSGAVAACRQNQPQRPLFLPVKNKDQQCTNNDRLRVTLCDWSCFHLHIPSTTSAHPCNPIHPNNIHGQMHTNLTEIKKQQATSNNTSHYHHPLSF